MCTMFMSLFSAISSCNVHGLSHVTSFNINGEFLVLYIKFPNYGFSIKCGQIRTWERILDNHKQVRSKANAYLNKRECSIQECDWEEHFQEFLLQIAMCQNLVVEKFSQWKWNYRLARGFKGHIQAKHDIRYIDRPNITSLGGKYLIPDSFCYAELLRLYYIASNTKFTDNEYQPEELSNELTVDIHNIDHIISTLK